MEHTQQKRAVHKGALRADPTPVLTVRHIVSTMTCQDKGVPELREPKKQLIS